METVRLLVCLVLAGSAAQEPSSADQGWGRLGKLRPNDKVRIYLRRGELLKGTVQTWTAQDLAVQFSGGGMRTISKNDVARVTKKSRAKGALWGGVVTLGIAAPIGAFAGPYLADWGNPSATVRLRHAAGWGLFFGGIGAGIGALVGAETTLYRLSGNHDVNWVRLSSKTGELPVPGASTQQTGALVLKVDPTGSTDFVLSFRQVAPALVWYRRGAAGWTRYVIEKEFLTVEAGGAAFDIDSDGDLDIVFGGDAQSDQLWWWENPYPNYDPDTSWTRRTIKSGGAKQHHDQIFADIKGTGKPQLIFWNQQAKSLFLASIPDQPKTASWPTEAVYAGQAGEGADGAAAYAEGVDAFDIDSDGRLDILAGNSWFRYRDGRFTPVRIGVIGGRIKGGRFIEGSRYGQVVIAPGDGSGPLRFYETKGDPANPASWQGRNLLPREMVHGHTLDVRDINGDGHLDIFAAEMAKWTRTPAPKDHAEATAWILYGDGKGNFRTTVLATGDGWHEGKLADLDGDGDLDVLNKPYTWDTPRVDVWLNNGTAPRRK